MNLKISHWSLGLLLAMGLLMTGGTGAAASLAGTQAFHSAEAAVESLAGAVSARDTAALSKLFGPGYSELTNPDPVQAAQEFDAFNQAYRQGHRLEADGPDRKTLLVGTGADPFPVPLVRTEAGWKFDFAAGKEELLNRRIGRNELSTLETLRAYVAAQREYASLDRDGDEVLEYAQRFTSSPGRKDGLYWAPAEGGDLSPLGPLAAAAAAEGYRGGKSTSNPAASSQPFHGYLFKILTRQGSAAPGGRYNYIINGHMFGGFAAVAYPAEYGETGVMTFIVNQQGKVYQRDLGARTSRIAGAMTEYNPGSGWELSDD